MKIILNKCYGGYSLSDELMRVAKATYAHDDDTRTNPDLIAYLQANPEAGKFHYTDLRVVEIPDTTTDWIVDEYDGMEAITYVVDGKLNWV